MHPFRPRLAVGSLAGALLSTAAFAHDGHGELAVDLGWMHWLLEPQHGVVVLGSATLAVVVMRRAVRAAAVRRSDAGRHRR